MKLKLSEVCQNLSSLQASDLDLDFKVTKVTDKLT